MTHAIFGAEDSALLAVGAAKEKLQALYDVCEERIDAIEKELDREAELYDGTCFDASSVAQRRTEEIVHLETRQGFVEDALGRLDGAANALKRMVRVT